MGVGRGTAWYRLDRRDLPAGVAFVLGGTEAEARALARSWLDTSARVSIDTRPAKMVAVG